MIVDRETKEAEAKKVVVQGEEAVANEKAAAAKAIKDECEGDLAVAMPMLEAALSALNTLSKVCKPRGLLPHSVDRSLVLFAFCV